MLAAGAADLFEQGNRYDSAGAWHEAAAAFAECARLAPDNSAALRNQGNALIKADRLEEAVQAYRECLLITPHDVNLLFDMGNALTALGRLSAAVESYVRCLRCAPDFGEAYVNLAGALRALGVLDYAITMAETAVRLMPQSVEAFLCLGGLLFDVGSFDAAIIWYGKALEQAPGHAGVLSSLANALHSAGRLDAALVLHERAYEAEPDNADYRYNRALSLLAAGDYARGWCEHEWRLQRARTMRLMPDRGPTWAGEAIAGKTILLHAEQGLGDTLQFIRYAKLVAARGARVIVDVPVPLARLVERIEGVDAVVTPAQATPRFDTHCALMSLPWLLGIGSAMMPPATPYIMADPMMADLWRARFLADDGKRRVGLVWAGGAHHGDIDSHLIDRRRSLPVEALAPLSAADTVRFISLQKDAAALPGGLELIDPMGDVADFADTAALVDGLDLVIAVDTAVAHLAGAMGKEVWLLSRYDGCWRWLDRQTETPWYPTMRLFRQARPGDWEGVMAQVATALQVWSA